MTQPNLLRTAFYARVSGEHQVVTETMDSQLDLLNRRLLADGLIVPPELRFIDDGSSGETLRPRQRKLDEHKLDARPTFITPVRLWGETFDPAVGGVVRPAPPRRDQTWYRARLRHPYPINPNAPRVAIARVEGSGAGSATARFWYNVVLAGSRTALMNSTPGR